MACPGFNLVLECSTEPGGPLTVFQGNLINCSNTNNEITLLHSRFNALTEIHGICNNGTILGYSLPVNTSSSCYISQLLITVTPDMIGKTIQCVYDNGVTTKEIGNFSIERTRCHKMSVTTAPSTGKLSIHVGIFS